MTPAKAEAILDMLRRAVAAQRTVDDLIRRIQEDLGTASDAEDDEVMDFIANDLAQRDEEVTLKHVCQLEHEIEELRA